MKINENEVFLLDDGTLDTVLLINGREIRFSQELAEGYRNESGELDIEAFYFDCVDIDEINQFV